MRIDHAAREGGVPPMSPIGHPPGQDLRATEPVPNLNTFWRQDQDGFADEEFSPGSYTGEWPETGDTQTDDFDYVEDLERKTHNFVLYCGAEGPYLPSSTSPHLASPLPAYPPRPPSLPAPRNSNGCGAIVHTSAVPRKRRGVWMARSGSTDAVIEMDSQYFDRSVVARMMKNSCGCVREGIGCRFCGNPLGTRYRPCKAAAEGLFSTTVVHPHPVCPSGAAYWRNPPSLSINTTSFIYTLFPDRVSSFPLSDSAFTPSPTNSQPVPRTAAQQSPGLQLSGTSRSSRPLSEFDADGNLVSESANSPEKGIEAWSGR